MGAKGTAPPSAAAPALQEPSCLAWCNDGQDGWSKKCVDKEKCGACDMCLPSKEEGDTSPCLNWCTHTISRQTCTDYGAQCAGCARCKAPPHKGPIIDLPK